MKPLQALCVIAFIFSACFAQAKNTLLIVVNDHLGTPQMLVDKNNHVVWQAEYDEFGKADILIEEVEFNMRLPGQYYDKETGLHYNYYRDYDPSLGRYVQSDQIGLRGGINTYAYVGGNPVSYVDPLGLKTCLLTVRNNVGLGIHSALYTTSGAGDFYDPSGGYGKSKGGEHLSGNHKKGFEDYHNNEGDTVEEQCKDTTQEQEEKIIAEVITRSTAAGPTCAINVSDVLGGSGVMSEIQRGTFWPGNLSSQFQRATLNVK
jgi:RHS repeat-associated protein